MYRVLLFVFVLLSCGGPELAHTERNGRGKALSFADVLSAPKAPGKAAAPVSKRAATEREPDESLITISALGDCALGDLRDGAGAPGSFSAELASQGDSMRYPFSGVREVLAGDDLTIANLEGVLTKRTYPKTEGLAIRGRPSYAAMLKHGSVELVDLANNHSYDYGAGGLRDTRATLAKHEVAHFGLGTVDRRRIRGVSVVNLGYVGGRSGTLVRMVREVQREKKSAEIVIVSFHWGLESVPVPDAAQRSLGRAAIRAGASLVLGHHPHVLQGVETYKGRHIVYSLANFVFGANSRPTDFDSMIYQERFHLKRGKLQRVEGRIVPVRISSTTRRNDFRPVLIEGHDRQRLLAKIERLSAPLTR